MKQLMILKKKSDQHWQYKKQKVKKKLTFRKTGFQVKVGKIIISTCQANLRITVFWQWQFASVISAFFCHNIGIRLVKSDSEVALMTIGCVFFVLPSNQLINCFFRVKMFTVYLEHYFTRDTRSWQMFTCFFFACCALTRHFILHHLW